MSEYAKKYYRVPSDIGRRIVYRGEGGIIYKDGGNYVSVNLDSEKPGHCVNIHPTDPGLKYLEMGTPRKMTRSQKRYQRYRELSDVYQFDSFKHFLDLESSL